MEKENNKSASRELIINTIIFGLGTFSSKIIMFILLPIYTVYMTTAELGEGELVVNFMNLIYPLVTINILSALLRYAMDKKINPKQALQSTCLIVSIGMIICGLFFLIININSSINSWKLYLWMLLVCYSFQQILSVFSKAMEKTKLFAIGNIVYTSSLLISSIILLIVLKRRTAGYLEGMILANIITFLFFAFNLKINKYLSKSRVDFALTKEMIIFSLPLIINSISWWITSFCDRFVLELNAGTEAVGIYSVSSKIPAIVSTISSVFMQAWTLSAIKAYQENNNEFFSDVFKKFSAVFIIWASIIIAISQFIMSFLVGSEFSESWLYVPLLICATVFSGFGAFYAVLYTAAKKNFSVMITTIVGAVVNVVLNFALIPKFGIQGAVIATMISQLIITIYRMIDSRKFIKFNNSFLKNILGTTFLISESILLINLKNILLTIGMCTIIILLYISEIKELIYIIYKKIKGVKNGE